MKAVSLGALVFGLSVAGASRAETASAPAGDATAPRQATSVDLESVAAPEPRPRPLLPPVSREPKLPWERHLEIGGGVAFVFRPTAGDDPAIRYAPAAGLALHAQWQLFRYLQFGSYYVGVSHSMTVPAGSLSTSEKGSVSPSARLLVVGPAKTYSFGAKAMPTWPITPRLTAWAFAGIGWGRIQVGRTQVFEGAGAPYFVHERADSFVEYPFGAGASFEVVPRWLAVRAELSGAIVHGQHDDAFQHAQAVDSGGHLREVGPLPAPSATFTQTVGLSALF